MAKCVAEVRPSAGVPEWWPRLPDGEAAWATLHADGSWIVLGTRAQATGSELVEAVPAAIRRAKAFIKEKREEEREDKIRRTWEWQVRPAAHGERLAGSRVGRVRGSW